MQHEDTDKGVRVTETSEDPYVVKLIQAHAKVVSGFVERGFVEAKKNPPIPDAKGSTPIVAKPTNPMNPVIPKHGSVVQFPNAAHQPRQGTKILIDVKRGSEPNVFAQSLRPS